MIRFWGARGLAFAGPVVLGIMILALMQVSKGAPEREDKGETEHPVRVIEAQPITATPRVLGHGTVEAAESWRAIVRVGGEVVEEHPDLGVGTIVNKGAVLFRIDDTDYKLSVANAEAAIESAKADLEEKQKSIENTRALLEIEKRNYALTKKEYERQKTLVQRGSATKAAMDSAERDMNSRASSLRELENTLDLIPSQLSVLKAKLAQAQSDLELAKLDLERTVVRAPFTGRVVEEDIAVGQVVNQGNAVLTLDTVDRVEVEAEIPVSRMITLFDPDQFEPINMINAFRMRQFLNRADLGATVRFTSGDLNFDWTGEVVRLRGALDSVARTLGVTVAVDAPFDQARPGKRPPLVSGMYVEVELSGAARDNVFVIPRTAVQDGQVFVADTDNRLRKTPVTVAYRQGGMAVIGDGIEPGTRIVVSDVAPAIDGMLLAPTTDTDLTRALQTLAAGSGPVR